MPLTREKCVACRAGSPHFTDEEIAELHPQVPEWKLFAEEGIRKLRRQFHFRNFAQALTFANAVGGLAEAEGHHPLLVTEWGRSEQTGRSSAAALQVPAWSCSGQRVSCAFS